MKAFAALMPAHQTLHDVIAEQMAEEAPDFAGEQCIPRPSTLDPQPVDPIFELQGQPQLVNIAQAHGRELALNLKRLVNQLEEGDFGEAAQTSDELSHRIRTHYLAHLSDASGVASR